MSSRCPWYAHFPADYLRKTSHLTMVQDGAYRRLLDHYYATAKPLSKIAEQLYRICRAFTGEERAAMDYVLSEFFDLEADGFHNNRADEEIAEAEKLRMAKTQSGRAGGLAARGKSGRKPNSTKIAPGITDTITPVIANQIANQIANNTPSPSPSQEEESTRSLRSRVPRARGTRWPADQSVPEEWIREGEMRRVEHGLAPIKLDLQAEQFANYWASKAGQMATKVDWRKTWINWALKATGENYGRGRPSRIDECFRGIGDFVEANIETEAGGPVRGAQPPNASALPSAKPLQVSDGGSGTADHSPAVGAAPRVTRNNLRLAGNEQGSDEPEIPDFLRRARPPAGAAGSRGCGSLPTEDRPAARILSETCTVVGLSEGLTAHPDWDNYPDLERWLRASCGTVIFNTWFAPCHPVITDDCVALVAPTELIRDHVDLNYKSRIERRYPNKEVSIGLQRQEGAAAALHVKHA